MELASWGWKPVCLTQLLRCGDHLGVWIPGGMNVWTLGMGGGIKRLENWGSFTGFLRPYFAALFGAGIPAEVGIRS